MKIAYIAPVASTTTMTADMNMIEEAIYNAIQNTIVIPFQTWCHDTWINLIDTSFIFCLALAVTGAICGILGLKKGYKVTVFAILFYLLLRFFSWGMGWY